MKRRYWLSFDLGLQGNYENLYEWLDNMEANDCGGNTATFVTDKTVKTLQEDLKFLDEKARIYIVFYHPDKKSFVGRFILGKRKRPQWAGFGGPAFESKEDK